MTESRKRRMHWPFLLGLTLLIFHLICSLPALCQSRPEAPQLTQQIGEIKELEGTVFIRKDGQTDFTEASKTNPINVQDTLLTDLGSKLWWKHTIMRPGAAQEQSEACLGQDSELTFSSYTEDRNSSLFSAEIYSGIARFRKKLPVTTPESGFTIFSPSATVDVISTDRAADFFVEILHNKVRVTVLWGRVRVKNISDQFPEERILSSCQQVSVEADQNPGPIAGASTEIVTALIKLTTIPDTLSEDVLNCEPLTGPAGLPPAEPPSIPEEIPPPEEPPSPPEEPPLPPAQLPQSPSQAPSNSSVQQR